MLSEDPLGSLGNGVGPSGSGGGPGNQIQQIHSGNHNVEQEVAQTTKPTTAPSRYESQKRRDWNTFGQYLKNHRPPLALARCSGAHVLEFLRYLDQFGKTKVHLPTCHFFGMPNPPHPCPCPLRQAWGSLDALIGRLRAAFEENGGKPESNPFGARVVRLYLREVRETQAKARGIAYEKKKRKRPPPVGGAAASSSSEQPLPQGHSQTNPLTGYSHQQAHQADQQQHQQHSPSLTHPLNGYTPNSNPLSPFSQQLHTSNLLHGYTPNSNPLNLFAQPNPLGAYQELQHHHSHSHSHTADCRLSERVSDATPLYSSCSKHICFSFRNLEARSLALVRLPHHLFSSMPHQSASGLRNPVRHISVMFNTGVAKLRSSMRVTLIFFGIWARLVLDLSRRRALVHGTRASQRQ
ncbi:hypothetical protein R1sor_010290 [Riccia sorocarpa]|uniref:ALOG domain-containing protein n=1 Tax=Riccia sorocarpa TaxID=122646 RepID=A0ABD3I3P5_9MARC